jgi:transposase
MALGRQKDRQGDLMVSWSEMPRSPGHVFYDRLQSVLIEGGFDDFAEEACRPYYAARMGAPSVPPGRYFRMHLVGYFEGIASERGLEWRCSDSLSLREFLRLESRARVPDHCWLSKTRTRLPHEVHEAVFDWVLALIAEAGLVQGDCIGVDASTMEANAALRSLVRRNTGDAATGRCWRAWPRRAASRRPRPRTWRAWTASAKARSCRTGIGSPRATPRPESPR